MFLDVEQTVYGGFTISKHAIRIFAAVGLMIVMLMVANWGRTPTDKENAIARLTTLVDMSTQKYTTHDLKMAQEEAKKAQDEAKEAAKLVEQLQSDANAAARAQEAASEEVTAAKGV